MGQDRRGRWSGQRLSILPWIAVSSIPNGRIIVARQRLFIFLLSPLVITRPLFTGWGPFFLFLSGLCLNKAGTKSHVWVVVLGWSL